MQLLSDFPACVRLSVYAVNEFYKMQQGDIPFYDTGSGATSQLANLQPQMESYNAAVNQSVEHAGITFTPIALEPYGFMPPPEIILNDEDVSMHTVEVENKENPGQVGKS